MTATPTSLTLRELRKTWPLVEVVEHWDAFAHVRHDLFGFVDVLAVGPNGVLAVQTTSAPNVSARVRKIADHPSLPHVRAAGWQIEVHGWRKNKTNRWELRRVDIS